MSLKTALISFWILFASLYFSNYSYGGEGQEEIKIVDATRRDSIRDGYRRRNSVGNGYSNNLPMDNSIEEETNRRLKRWRDQNKEIPVNKFLGDNIDFIEITTFDNSIKEFEEAGVKLRQILNSVIISPEYPHSTPTLHIAWAEVTTIRIAAMVHFKNGSIGKIETDGGDHLFLQDSAGVYWWHRWWKGFPRKAVN